MSTELFSELLPLFAAPFSNALRNPFDIYLLPDAVIIQGSQKPSFWHEDECPKDDDFPCGYDLRR